MNTTPPPSDLLRITEAAKMIPGRTRGKAAHCATLFRWVKAGRLRAWRVGSRLYVSEAELMEMFVPVEPKAPRFVPPAAVRQQDAETSRILRQHGLESPGR